MTVLQKPPAWFWAVAVLLLLWNLMGDFACIQQFRLGAEAMGPATDYDRALYASMPVWYNWVYAGGVGLGTLGVVALFLRRAVARPLFIGSLVCVVIQFGYLFGTSDLIKVKGAWTTYFPLVIALVCLVQIWLSGVAIRRGWIG